MRLTEEQFFALTPRLFYALRKRHKRTVEHTELLHAITTSTLANHSMCRPEKPYRPSDFMPSVAKREEGKAPKPKKWTRKGFAEGLAATRQHLSGWFVVKPAPKESAEETQ